MSKKPKRTKLERMFSNNKAQILPTAAMTGVELTEDIKKLKYQQTSDTDLNGKITATSYEVNGDRMSEEEFVEKYGTELRVPLTKLQEIAMSGNDDIVEAIRSMADIAADREEVAEAFEEYLDYDPISYFDKRDIQTLLTKGERIAKGEVEDADAIVEAAYQEFCDNKEAHFGAALKTALKDSDERNADTFIEGIDEVLLEHSTGYDDDDEDDDDWDDAESDGDGYISDDDSEESDDED